MGRVAERDTKGVLRKPHCALGGLLNPALLECVEAKPRGNDQAQRLLTRTLRPPSQKGRSGSTALVSES